MKKFNIFLILLLFSLSISFHLFLDHLDKDCINLKYEKHLHKASTDQFCQICQNSFYFLAFFSFYYFFQKIFFKDSKKSFYQIYNFIKIKDARAPPEIN